MKLPSHLNALRAFEASARHQSFAGAASELHVTPAAVGQLVRSLEQWLGKPLFHRATSGPVRLIPTEAAERTLPVIRSGLDRLALGYKYLQESSANYALSVTVSPAFAAKWLLPRIHHFQALCPDIDVRLETSLRPVDFIAGKMHIGVRYGTGSWPGLAADKLMSEEVYPVCSPALLQRLGALDDPHQLARETLIHDLSMDGHPGFPTWEAWMHSAGVTGSVPLRGMKVNSSAAVLQAAAEGHGIALARSAMAHDDLAAGRLVRLFPEISFTSQLDYYIVYRPECASLPGSADFRSWLQHEAALQQSASHAGSALQ